MFNTDNYRSIWTNGAKPYIFFLPTNAQEGQKEDECDVMTFNSATAAVKAFDVIISALNNSYKSVSFLEIDKKLHVKYNKGFETEIDEQNESCIIKNPAEWSLTENDDNFDKVIEIGKEDECHEMPLIIIQPDRTKKTVN